MKSKILLMALLFCLPLQAFQIPDRPLDYVDDEAHLLTSSEQSDLSLKLKNFEDETSNQIVVAIFPSLDGEEISDVSIHIAEKWKIGQKDKDNGVIVLIFPNDRQLRIEVGYGLEGAIPDVLASQIIDRIIKPAFRSEKYYEGINKATDVLMLAAKGEFHDNLAQTSGEAWLEFLKFILIAIFLLGFGWFGRRFNRYGGTYSSGGWSSGSSGGFSGGGGGSFGGGGSSGSW